MKRIKSRKEESSWTFLSNHAHVMICIRREPTARMRDIAQYVGVTERAVQLIIAELVEEGYLSVEKKGRCNHYRVLANKPLRHKLEAHHPLQKLLDALM